MALAWSRSLRTTFSPYMVGSVETRRSIFLLAALMRIRPSWGFLFSEMSMLAMILILEETAG